MLYELTTPHPSNNNKIHLPQKDYSRPLHVDCSVEYELPSQVKPPVTDGHKPDPLLMIHPCYFRKIEAQRRSPFINNLPGRGATPLVNNASGGGISQQQSAVRSPIHQQHPRNSIQQQTMMHQQQMQQAGIQYATVPQYHPQPARRQLPDQRQWGAQLHHQYNLKPAMAVGKSEDMLGLPHCNSAGVYSAPDGGLWSDSNRSPLVGERFPDTVPVGHSEKYLSSKYRQYLRTHRLHPYMNMTTSTAFPQFPQMQQISCYNV